MSRQPSDRGVAPTVNITFIAMLTLFRKKTTPKQLIYTCQTLCMAKFVKCLVKAEYELVGGEKSWEVIFNEYLTLSGDESISQLLSLLKSIAILSNRIQLIEIIVQQMAIKPIPELAQQLRNMGFRFQYTDDLENDLKKTVNQAKQYLLKLQQDQKELEDLRKSDGKAATEQDYEMQYSAIEQFKGVPIDPETYMVARYAADVSRMKQQYQPTQN